MTDNLLEILQAVAQGKKTPQEALQFFQTLPYKELCSGLTLDVHRKVRTGLPEVVFAPGKDNKQLVDAVTELKENHSSVLVTKVKEEQGRFLERNFAQGCFWGQAGLFTLGGSINLDTPWKKEGEVVIVTAGTSDLPVALEAFGTGQFYDLDIGLIADVGVAGLHRVHPQLNILQKARILIVVAGMEGALPSVLAGFLSQPVIAVPTSVGYGANFQGLAALLGMLGSCAPGVAVVNIDNGFGAASLAAKILNSLRPLS